MEDDIEKIANEIRKGYNSFKLFEKGNEILDGLKNLKQVKKEILDRVESLKSEEKDLIAKKTDWPKQLAETEAKANAIISNGQSAVAAMLADAQKWIDAETSKVNVLKDGIGELKAEYARETTRLNNLKNDIEAVKSEHNAIHKAKEEALAKFNEVLGK